MFHEGKSGLEETVYQSVPTLQLLELRGFYFRYKRKTVISPPIFTLFRLFFFLMKIALKPLL